MNIARRAGAVVFSLTLTLCSLAQTGLPTLSQPIQPQVLNRGPVQLDLRTYFGVPGVTGQVVQFSTTAGRVNVELRAPEAPRHVANFLSYVSKNAYDNTLIHRIDNLGAVVPAMVQGGGYVAATMPPPAPEIPRSSPIALEYQLPNTRGTLAAMRNPTDPNSASSEWFFNTLDNSASLGPANGGGYSAFGRVIGTGMTVVDAIAQVPTIDLTGTIFSRIPLRNLTATQTSITPANYMIVSSVRVIPIYPPVTGDPTAVLSFAATPAAAGTVAANISGATLTLTPLAVGTTNVTVRATDANGNSSLPTTFSVTVPPGALLPPLFVSQPASQTVASGTTVVFNAIATGGESGIFPLRYQWFWNGLAIPVPESPLLVLRAANSQAEGVYTCLVTNASGSTLSSEARLTVVPAKAFDVGRLVNLAIRTNAGALDETLIVGFALGGLGTNGAKPLLVRGVGPSLTQFGVSDVLTDPVLSLFQGTAMLTENDNWLGNAQISARAAQVGAFALMAPSALDAAFALSQNPGAYTVQIRGRITGTTGTALAEIYDATVPETIVETSTRLVNASARALVSSTNQLIAGFVIGGNTPVTVLIRGIGPTLEGFGISGALENPRLQLFTGTTFLRDNDDWGGDPQLADVSSSVGAFPITNFTSRDSIILVTLPPGGYTAQVSGVAEGEGVALVEVYEVR